MEKNSAGQTIIIIVALVILAAIGYFVFMRTGAAPAPDDGRVNVQVDLPEGGEPATGGTLSQ